MLFRVAALLIALAFPVSAQTPAQAPKPAPRTGQASTAKDAASPAALPDARALIQKYVTAIGGRDAVRSHKSEHATGTVAFAGSGISGTVEIFGATNPDRTLEKVSISGVGDIVTGFDGEHGWSIDPMTGPRLQIGDELDGAKLDSAFYGELRDPSVYPSVKTLERTEFEGHTCYKVSLTSVYGITDFDYYDVTSGLLVGSVHTRVTPMSKIQATSILGDYKKFGNLLQPTTLVERAMNVEQKVTLESIEYDNVDPSVFELPAAIQALIK